MKTLVFAFFASLLLFGCGSPNLDDPGTLDDIIAEAIDKDKLQERGKEGEELSYAPNAQTPYTGWAKLLYKNGQVMDLRHFKGGKLDGLVASWYENGQKEFEESYKDGEVDGVGNQWYENGQKRSVGNFKYGKLDGLWTSWYENGQKWQEENFKEGKLVTATCWKPNGDKCPITNVVNGNGPIVYYSHNGTPSDPRIYKDGEIVED